MTEVVVDNAEQHNDNHAVPQPSTSAGTMLRQAREAQQMSVQTLASALKVPVYKLQALEDDRWDQLTDSVFTRSLALSVCRVLRIDSEPVLAGLPKLQGAKLSTNPEGINAPFKEKSLRSLMSPSQEPASGKVVKAAVAVLIAVAGGAGLYFLPQWQAADESDVAELGSAETSTAAATTEPLFMPQPVAPTVNLVAPVAVAELAAPATPVITPALPVPVVPPTAASAPAGQQTPASASSTASATQASTTTAAATVATELNASPAPVSAEAASAPALGADAKALRFTASGETWVQVRNAQNRVVMEKILQAGDVYQETLTGRPLQVVVGNSGATTLEIDGATFDLAASAKNNVARFEVK